MPAPRVTSLLQFFGFGFGFAEDGDVGVGILPEGEEILIGGAGLGGIAGEGFGASDTNVRESAGRTILHEPAVIDNFLKFRGGGASLLAGQIRFPTGEDWDHARNGNACKIKWRNRLEKFEGTGGIFLGKGDFGLNRRQPIRAHHRIGRETLNEILAQGVRPSGIARFGEYKRRFRNDVARCRRGIESGGGILLGLGKIAEKSFTDSGSILPQPCGILVPNPGCCVHSTARKIASFLQVSVICLGVCFGREDFVL